MEFRSLRSFLRLAELGSFTKTAEELGYAQSTISTQIKQIEAEIGAPLFERIGKKNVLTPIGISMIPYANQLLQIQEKIRNVTFDVANASGRIRIGIVESLMVAFLMPILQQYRRIMPHITLEIQLGITSDLINLLRENQVDIVFTMGASGQAEDCHCVASHPENAVFFCHQSHPLAQQDPLPLSVLFEQPIILTGRSSFLQNELEKIAFQNQLSITSFIQTGSSKLIIALVRQNMGISFLPEYLIRAQQQEKELAILKTDMPCFTFYSNIQYHKNKWVTPQMKTFIHLIQEQWNLYDDAISERPPKSTRCHLSSR